MKKITIFFILIYFLFPNKIFALESSEKCLIQDWTSPVITQYIVNVRQVIGNINSELIKSSPKKSIGVNITKGKTLISKWFFTMTNWDYYESYFDFYVTYSITDEYVPEIWRDYDILENEANWLDKYYNYVLNNWYLEINLEKDKVCWNIDNCNYSWDALSIITKIKSELEYLKNFYRKSIIDSQFVFDKTKIQLIDSNFESEFKKYYNSESTINCSSNEWWFFDRISKRAQEIINWTSISSDWINTMKQAVLLAKWEWYDEQDYSQIEEELLQNELGNQWIWWSQADVMIQNLRKYNNQWFSLDNNFITNSFNYFYSQVKSQIKEFDKTVLETFDDDKTTQVTIDKFSNKKDLVWIEKDISENIAELYNIQLPYTSSQEELIGNIITRLINMHNNLTNSIEILDKTIKVSEKVCNSQAFWKWKCEY